MFVNVSGTVSFLTPTDRNPVAPSAPPMEQSESGGVAAADESGGSDYENVSPTIRNIASSQIVVGGDGKKQSNNESAISILEYERTLRPKGIQDFILCWESIEDTLFPTRLISKKKSNSLLIALKRSL